MTPFEGVQWHLDEKNGLYVTAATLDAVSWIDVNLPGEWGRDNDDRACFKVAAPAVMRDVMAWGPEGA